jgi:crotonobetainyl-CoA:carnitine CoA-transferase CaiB-like acyl-CoA transferase
MNGARLGARLDIPKIGEHTQEVLSSLGYDGAAVAQLVESGVVGVL